MRVRPSLHKCVGFIALVAMLLAPLPLTNQSTSIAWAQSSDPPARVGRLNYINGPVSFAPGGLNQWAQATLNYPLTTGTALWTDENGRAELHIGSTAIRMDQTTELDILNLDDQTTQLRVAQGTVNIGLHQLAVGERFEVATPSASIMLVRPGHYRFRADANGVWVTVWTGQVDVANSTNTFPVYPGQTVMVSDAGYQIVATPSLDEFGQWSLAREQREEQALKVASLYVPPTMTGYEDLATYGTWRTAAGYGAVWFPAVQQGWAPYRHGHWVWISPWGWTWVDSAPWGFAPFHYGRWAVIGGTWGWVPGPVFVRPVFAPALVVFLVIGNSIGWFPLAPQEVYVPSYYCSRAYYRNINVNIVNINITNINVTNFKHTFRHSPEATTFVRHGTFVGSDPVGTSIISAPKGEVERARAIASAPLQPDVQSVLGRPQGTAGSHKPPTILEQRAVVVRQAPPAPVRPQGIEAQAPMRSVPVKPAVEPRSVRPEPRPAPAQPAVPPAPQPAPAQPVIPQPPQRVVPAPNPAPPRPIAPSPNPGQPGVPAPRPVTPEQPAVPPHPVQPGVPTPHRVQPVAPAPYPPESRSPAPGPRPQPAQPAVPGPNPLPTPHPVRPVAPGPRSPEPNAPVPQPGQPAPQPRPAPTPPNVAPMPPQSHPASQAPRNQVRTPVCDEHSPYYDPRQCPQTGPKRH